MYGFGDTTASSTDCDYWTGLATTQSQAPGASSFYMIVTQPGPLFDEIRATLADIVPQRGYPAAVAELTCFAQWQQVQTGITAADWMNNQGKALLAMYKPKIAPSLMRAVKATAPPVATKTNPMANSGAIAQPASSIKWWMWVAGAAAIGGIAYVVAKKKHLI